MCAQEPVLRSALKQAIRWSMLARNPGEGAELPRMQHKEIQALSQEEARRFLSKAREDEYGVVFAFALAAGMRPEEYLALK